VPTYGPQSSDKLKRSKRQEGRDRPISEDLQEDSGGGRGKGEGEGKVGVLKPRWAATHQRGTEISSCVFNASGSL